MNRKKKIIEVVEPGEFDEVIISVSFDNNAIRLHIAPDVYARYDSRIPERMEKLAKVACSTLDISPSEFKRKFDADSITEVAKKLDEALKGKEVRVRIRGTIYFLTFDRRIDSGKTVEQVEHRMEVICDE